ncbi:MAG: glycoside hydrolase family 18 protein [Bacteroidales bacterium]|nr:glycoside hydrolase family 18 protein [Bacteroidales bacterium]
MRKSLFLLAVACCLAACTSKSPSQEELGTKHGDPAEKILLAYVFRMNELPDATYLTHINYAFGHVNDSFNGVRLDQPDELHRLVSIKRQYPHVKILLSIGGWGSGNFSEMCAEESLRTAFAKDCRRVVDEFKLDGIDIDWEYPGEDVAEISASPDDIDNYTLLMRDIRQAIGPDKLLTHATAGSGKFYDFPALDAYIDWTNVMSYDLGNAPYHNAPLYPSDLLEPGSMSVSQCVEAHLEKGIPPEKLVLGLPFYGRGKEGFPRWVDVTKAHLLPGYTYHWDSVSQVAYLTEDATGDFAFGYDEEKSLRIKALYALDKGLKGAMYWAYNGDNAAGDLRRTVYQTLNGTLATPGLRPMRRPQQ